MTIKQEIQSKRKLFAYKQIQEDIGDFVNVVVGPFVAYTMKPELGLSVFLYRGVIFVILEVVTDFLKKVLCKWYGIECKGVKVRMNKVRLLNIIFVVMTTCWIISIGISMYHNA